MHKENKITKWGWRTLVIMKDLMMINSGLPNNFWMKVIETANYFQNRLPTKSRNHRKVIPEEFWTRKWQNL